MFDFKNLTIACLFGAVTWQELNNRANEQNNRAY